MRYAEKKATAMSAERPFSAIENSENLVTMDEPTEYSFANDVNKAMMPEAGVTMTRFIRERPDGKKTKSTLNGPIIDRGKRMTRNEYQKLVSRSITTYRDKIASLNASVLSTDEIMRSVSPTRVHAMQKSQYSVLSGSKATRATNSTKSRNRIMYNKTYAMEMTSG